jgi:hypothetical protein
MEFDFDPRDLISLPFIPCPVCDKGSFGCLTVAGDRHVRRCRECSHTQTYPLWSLKKAIIYVDQFAISNMMKAIDDTASGHGRAKADPFWLELFEALERSCKLQLAICPDSDQHHQESLVSPFFESLERGGSLVWIRFMPVCSSHKDGSGMRTR